MGDKNNAKFKLGDFTYKFIVEDVIGSPNLKRILCYKDGYLGGESHMVINEVVMQNFGNNPKIEFMHGKSGTYDYFKATISCDNIGYCLIWQLDGWVVLNLVYRDKEFVDLNTTRLRINTVKGGLKVKRVSK